MLILQSISFKNLIKIKIEIDVTCTYDFYWI